MHAYACSDDGRRSMPGLRGSRAREKCDGACPSGSKRGSPRWAEKGGGPQKGSFSKRRSQTFAMGKGQGSGKEHTLDTSDGGSNDDADQGKGENEAVSRQEEPAKENLEPGHGGRRQPDGGGGPEGRGKTTTTGGNGWDDDGAGDEPLTVSATAEASAT